LTEVSLELKVPKARRWSILQSRFSFKRNWTKGF